jgi:hypothetical protein
MRPEGLAMLFTQNATFPTARLRLKKSETGRGRPRANQVTLRQISLSHERGIRYFVGKYGPRKMSTQQELSSSATRKRSRWAWLVWVYVASLIAARILWATTAYYEWIPLGVAGAILGFTYLIRPREPKDRDEIGGDNVNKET